jgi:hypothetical protein
LLERIFIHPRLSYPIFPSCIPSSIRISRIKYLGNILRHPSSPEYIICLNNSRSFRTISSPFRRGAPMGAQLATESAHRWHHLWHHPPIWGHLLHSFYTHFTIVELKEFPPPVWSNGIIPPNISSSVFFPLAENRKQRRTITPKMK